GQVGRVRQVSRVRRVLAFVLLIAFLPALPALRASPPLPAPQSRPAARPKNRLFPAAELALIEPADRDQWQPPEQIMDDLNIAEGSVVADLGAGGGWFTVHLA